MKALTYNPNCECPSIQFETASERYTRINHQFDLEQQKAYWTSRSPSEFATRVLMALRVREAENNDKLQEILFPKSRLAGVMRVNIEMKLTAMLEGWFAQNRPNFFRRLFRNVLTVSMPIFNGGDYICESRALESFTPKEPQNHAL